MLQFDLERLRRLPLRRDETWQGGIMRMPNWIAEEGKKPTRPWAALWLAVLTDEVGYMEVCTDRHAALMKLGEGVQAFALDEQRGGYLPGRIELRERETAGELREALAGLNVAVEVQDDLPVLDAACESLSEHFTKGPQVPSALTGDGVTLESMRLFAEAAAGFHQAAPWRHLMDEDLITVESPRPPEDMRYLAVLGAAGKSAGISFYSDPEEHWAIQRSREPGEWFHARKKGIWSLSFQDITRVPLTDADLWEEHALPVAGERGCPYLVRIDPDGHFQRPDARMLTFVTHVMMALARATEPQFDSGRWMIAAEPTGGAELAFSLPDLLNPPNHQELMRRGFEPDRRFMEAHFAQMDRFLDQRPLKEGEDINKVLQREFEGRLADDLKYPPRNALEQAQDLCYLAFDAIGRRQYLLAKQAIETCADCADGYVLLAERQSDPMKAGELYRLGMEAGERALGTDRMKADAGRFWGITDTRPYMRARYGLAQSLEQCGRGDEALEHYRELLRLNPGDNQGVRQLYLPLLLKLNRDAEAARYMNSAPPEPTAAWSFTRALLAYRLGGDCPTSRKELASAVKKNPHVVTCLIGEPPANLPWRYSLGSREEAIICADELRPAIEVTPGALKWLETQGRPQAPGREQRHFKERRRRSR